jgi:hypothetical protein
LHQTRSVLAAVSGGWRGLREREPPSFGPMQEDLRICFETPEDGQAPRGNHASKAPHTASQNNFVRRNIAPPRDGVKNRAGNFRRWTSSAGMRHIAEQRSAVLRADDWVCAAALLCEKSSHFRLCGVPDAALAIAARVVLVRPGEPRAERVD